MQGKKRDLSGLECQERQKGLLASNWTSVGLMPRSRIVRWSKLTSSRRCLARSRHVARIWPKAVKVPASAAREE